MSPEVLVPAEHARDSEEGLRSKDVVRLAAAALIAVAVLHSPAVSAQATGTIRGRITFTGKEPGNKVIRMGMDPMCAAVNRGKQVVNEIYAVGDGNTLGNAFVKVEGTFPATPVP